jgi:hypothetical protein
MTFFSERWFIISIFFNSFGAMNGPFFKDLDIVSYLYSRLTAFLASAADNVFVRLLVLASLITQGRFTPWRARTGLADRLAAFTTTMWMIPGGHRRTADCRTYTKMALAACLAKLDIAVFKITNLPNRGVALLANQADFTRGHADLGKIAFLGQ